MYVEDVLARCVCNPVRVPGASQVPGSPVKACRDSLHEIVDGAFNLEAYDRGGLAARLSAPGFPEFQYSAIKEEFKRLFNVKMPGLQIKPPAKRRSP